MNGYIRRFDESAVDQRHVRGSRASEATESPLPGHWSLRGANLRVRLSDLSKRILLPKDEEEVRNGVFEAVRSPGIYQEILDRYPNWDLPSEATLRNVLIRDFGIQEGAAGGFITDLLDSIEYERVHGPREESGVTQVKEAIDESSPRESLASKEGKNDLGLMRLPMPGSCTYMMIPENLTRSEADRILSWLTRVVTPALEFAAEEPAIDEPH